MIGPRPRRAPGGGRTGAALLAVALVTALVLPADADEPRLVSLSPPVRDAAFAGADPGLSLVLVEVATGQVIASRDGERRRPVASAIKLVTALAAVDALPPGSIITVGEEVRGAEGSVYGLRPGDVRSVEDLLAGLLLRSGNDVALSIAHAVDGGEEAFVGRMARVLGDLGIDARPVSATGLADGDALSAAELAVVARAALAEPRIAGLISVPVLEVDGVGRIENRNLFLGQYAGATGLKTGFTSAAGYVLVASARRDDRELVAVVLGAPDDLARRSIAVRLLEHGFEETRLTALRHSVTLRTSTGPVRFGTEGVPVTLPLGAEVVATWAPSLRPDDAPAGVPFSVLGAPAGAAPVTRRDARDAASRTGLGHALADGVYAALRPFGLTGGLR